MRWAIRIPWFVRSRSELFRQARCRYLILKLGERGLIGYRSPGAHAAGVLHGGQLRRPPGGPDWCRATRSLSYAALTLVATDHIVVASVLGSLGAAVACELQGNSPVSPAKLQDKIDMLEQHVRYEVGRPAVYA